jgi:NAD(P)-dependent dehydrogenase (short-subunit alcohol dehydrogenase family)
MQTALVTGAGQGLGRGLTTALANRGWRVVITARTESDLVAVADEVAAGSDVVLLTGDITDPAHRSRLVDAVETLGSLDVLVNSASTLGPRGLGPLAALGADELSDILTTNVIAAHALTIAVLPNLRQAAGIVLNVSSDAAVEHYQTWGGYAASKAALDHLTSTLAAEEPGILAYAVDPGDMRTQMHQDAFPGVDIGDRPLPDEVAVPGILRLLDARPASGRYRAADLLAPTGAAL